MAGCRAHCFLLKVAFLTLKKIYMLWEPTSSLKTWKRIYKLTFYDENSWMSLKSMLSSSLVTMFILTQAACKTIKWTLATYLVSASDEGNGSRVLEPKCRLKHSLTSENLWALPSLNGKDLEFLSWKELPRYSSFAIPTLPKVSI